ncbi:MAG: polysaccharide biosynthesis protein [Syntrophales bacterium]|jgi:FlaA1/EpsC-like NDP-sugar epimerase|nr:polysaccharide biosynthesis protein [Syntrophales bacterium]MCK9528057.1 polysaccharide biosynthesis protein [Syntrophales bacterium]MDX9922347.1 nucleoside-diphosphate sugar epimerase/dehydratase [Syntrophales bacterium]
MKAIIRNRNFWFMIMIDMIMIALAYYGAFWIRYEGQIPALPLGFVKKTLPLVIVLKIVLFYYFNLYRGMWRYTSIMDMINLFKANILSSFSILLAIFFLYRLEFFPRSVVVIDFILALFFVAGSRLGVRLYFSGITPGFSLGTGLMARKGKRLLLIGAGDAGERIIREIMENDRIKVTLVGILDDDPGKQGKTIHGVPVMGGITMVDQIRDQFDEILITLPSATSAEMKQIVAVCEASGKPFKTMPPLGELIDGKVSLTMVREVTIADVIGRDEVYLDSRQIGAFLTGKRVLITGAGGSIGAELTRQVARFRPSALGLVDFSEYNLYQVEIDLRDQFQGLKAGIYLADLRNEERVDRIFRDFKPLVVFHAAAYKHVPLQEANPWEAVENNLLGTKHAVASALAAGAEKFVMVSTDKAVRPTNIMGATKRVCECLAMSANHRGQTRFMAVRFGNVIGSSGSVIPLFRRQIARGGPVTVTHPEVTRFFMSIPEAARLILQAGSMGEGGEIFILKMGEPVRIRDMARSIIRLSGFEPDEDIKIVYTGLRPGEKLYEELITEGEGIIPTHHDKIMVLRGNAVNRERLNAEVDELLAVSKSCSAEKIKEKLSSIVPDYRPESRDDPGERVREWNLSKE